ncbi:MAG TPA: DCC1-like thiol-disulfide oxidoreductase family protein, partial [Verrucomicrobiae bacterium]|nr:DCC1-like thiol-disulfide oxidoreductase family protein [Verrucomicrobiae bacterium]
MTGSAPTPETFAYRRDPRVPAFDDSHPIVIFDGACVMCSRFVQFLLRADRRGRLRFLTAQSELGQALYAHFGLRSDAFDTYVLLERGRARVKSDAALRIFALLGAPYALLCAGRVAPWPWRDALYDFVARNRLRWFGAREVCYA